MAPFPVLIGLAVGVVVGLTSTGGGALLTPALVLLLGVPPATAVGSDVFIGAAMKLFGGGVYATRGAVHWPTALRLATGSIPGATAGLLLLSFLPHGLLDAFLRRTLGGVLVVVGTLMLWRLWRSSRGAPRPMPTRRLIVVLGFVTGLLVSTTSVGSGTIVLAALQSLFPLTARVVVGTDLIHALLLSSFATAGHLIAGRVDVPLSSTVLVGAIPGVLLGARIATVVAERPLRLVLALVVLTAGIHLAISAPAPSAGSVARPDPRAATGPPP
jgi:uncharacterized membrane protein YfcA